MQFSLFSAADMMRASHLSVCNRELYQMPSRAPVSYGVLDRRLVSAVVDAEMMPEITHRPRRVRVCAGNVGQIFRMRNMRTQGRVASQDRCLCANSTRMWRV
jgi:hypothetical protein